MKQYIKRTASFAIAPVMLKFFVNLLLAFAVCGISCEPSLASNSMIVPKSIPLIEVEYAVKNGKTVTDFLYGIGIGNVGSSYRIYGAKGWLALTRRMNPKLDLNRPLPNGSKVRILVPIDLFTKYYQNLEQKRAGSEFNGLIDNNGVHEIFKLEIKKISLSSNKSITTALFDYGIGKPKSKFRIYGRYGFLNLVKALNPKIKNWSQLNPNERILVAYPKAEKIPENISQEVKPAIPAKIEEVEAPIPEEPSIATSEPDKVPPISENKDEVATVKEETKPKKEMSFWQRLFGGSSAEEEPQNAVIAPVDVPLPTQETQEAVQPEKIEAEVPTKPVEPVETRKDYSKEVFAAIEPNVEKQLRPIEKPVLEAQSRKVRKVNPEVEKKAWEMSIFDAMKPGMEGVFQGISGATAAGYLGARYGYSLAPKSEPLLPKISVIGILAELRGGALDGVRFYFDKSPTVKDNFQGNTLSLGWQRMLLAYAIKFDAPFLADYFHITPKLGRYTLSATLPVQGASESAAPRTVNIPGALGTGIEADMEWSKFWYILRGWVAQDLSLGSSDRDSVVSRRFGLDLFVKGSGVSVGKTRLSISYLGFYVNESIMLSGKVDGEKYNVILDNSYVGLGTSLSW